MGKHYFLLLPVLIACFSMQVSAQVNLQQGLVAYYPFNGNANDESGNGNNGVVYGSTLSEDRFGNGNSAYYFDGENDYIHIGYQSDYFSHFIDNIEITVNAWIKIGDNWNDEIIYHLGGCHNAVALGVLSNGHLRFALQKDDNWRYVDSEAVISLNAWIHVIGLNNLNGTYLYINGNQEGFVQNSFIWNTGEAGHNIGANYSQSSITNTCYNDGNYHEFFKGLLDEIRIYNRALNEQEIYALYTEDQPPQTNTISNILINQRNNGSGIVDVYFNLYGAGSQYNITLKASFDGENTYTAIPASFLSGDVSNISPGTNKHIVWDGLGSHPNTYSTATKLRIIAN
jgi:hypothetical protein